MEEFISGYIGIELLEVEIIKRQLMPHREYGDKDMIVYALKRRNIIRGLYEPPQEF